MQSFFFLNLLLSVLFRTKTALIQKRVQFAHDFSNLFPHISRRLHLRFQYLTKQNYNNKKNRTNITLPPFDRAHQSTHPVVVAVRAKRAFFLKHQYKIKIKKGGRDKIKMTHPAKCLSRSLNSTWRPANIK